ncbi:MAG: alkaline phosphatase family protein [Actinomycetota bacterium]
MNDAAPTLPAWGDGCVSDIVPAVFAPTGNNSLLPESVVDARTIVLLVIDGLGWHQLQAHARVAPTLVSLAGRPITTIAPSTTSVALTSIATGTHPGEHGVVGYRIDVDGDVLNCLSWRTPQGDARNRIVPEEFQTVPAFMGERPVVVQNAPFRKTGFTRAHLAETRQQGWRTLPTLPVEVRRAVSAGEPFVYAYYDGIDKIAHEFAFGEHYRAELAAVDRMVGELMMDLPRDAALIITADHGQVDCSNGRTDFAPEVLAHVDRQSGEARFRWLHAEPGHQRALLEAAEELHGNRAWIRSAEQTIDEGWFGPTVTEQARRRLGDVAVVAHDDWYFVDPVEGSQSWLLGRHGSLTPAEMHVPLLTYTT